MLDFMMISSRSTKKGSIEIYPKFIVRKSEDLMIRGGDFYAVWDENKHLWCTEEQVAHDLIDDALDKYAKEHKHDTEDHVRVLHMWDAESGMVDRWHKFVQKQMRDSFHQLDEKLIFSNTDVTKEDYASRKLPYPLEKAKTPAYDELMSTLYTKTERQKLEWAIGAIISGDSKEIQKFMVLYGPPGSGKSTILNIIQDLFAGYFCVFDAKALGSANNSFALEAFKSNPLIAIQHDGDLSRIEDNTRLNSLVSHEMMTVNEKFKSTYANRFKCFLFMGTNKPVKISDSKSGIIRRLIDVSPSGKKIPKSKYDKLIASTKFELGGIAAHCLEVYESDPMIYDSYIPTSMLGASNDFYNYILEEYDLFKREDSTTLKQAYDLYKEYCTDAGVVYPYSKRIFKEELKSYFKEFQERSADDGTVTICNLYKGFITNKFEYNVADHKPEPKPEKELLQLECTESYFDKAYADCPAQYATADETPRQTWANCINKLCDLDTKKLHYVKVPENLIVIDFDLKDASGNKCFKLNAEAAAEWPPTYAELSKGGQGIHLHYIYNGDVNKLSRVYDKDIEIKVFTGNSSLRRKLSKCNDLEVSTISTGLPLKKEDKVVAFEGLANEKALRTVIAKNLNKEYIPGTKPSIDFIFKALDDAYNSGMVYDVSDMRPAITTFAGRSTNHASYCLATVNKMKFKSEQTTTSFDGYDTDQIIFFDVEVFPNLFVVVWKAPGKNCVKMINPTARDIENLMKFRLVGFNCRKYDNHILYARYLGETNEQLYIRSQKIINKQHDAFIPAAYNVSYTDIYDFSSKKQSLKKFEIELGIRHLELGLPWDKPVPEELWEKVAEYCVNDVVSTEAVWNARQGDFVAREILATLTGGSVNDTTNSLSAKLIFGNEKHPQGKFRYRNLAEPIFELPDDQMLFLKREFPEMMAEPHGEAKSLLPYFQGYVFTNDHGKKNSYYRGEPDIGEGGRVWAKPGMYGRTITFDVASMHPHSITSEYLFGPYTEIFNDLMETRIAIKHKDFEKAKKMFNGKLAPFLDDPGKAKMLAGALKIVINSAYGETAASFDNPFRDWRNIDNIVAKRGALFMQDLLMNVQERGGEVVHIKTDSIKVVNPSEELVNYILNFGKRYGYTFEVEHIFEKFCLVNNAVYIAKCAADDPETPGEWTATGTQFQVPYVFKTLFTKEPIIFDDLCEVKEVKGAIYLDLNESGYPDTTAYEKELTKLSTAYDKGQPDYKEGTFTPGRLYKLESTPGTITDERDRLYSEIEKGHNYRFVGKVGEFCPIKPGKGGGLLVKSSDAKYLKDSVTGAKDYRWLESEIVNSNGLQDNIDISYFNALVDDAVKSISQFGDFEWFASDD